MHHSMHLGVGTTPGSPVPSTNCYQRSCRLDITWSPTQLSRGVLAGALGRYVPPFRRVHIYQLIQMNSPIFSPLTVNSFHSDSLQNGGCVHCKVPLVASVFPSPLRIYLSDKIYWKSVSTSTMCGCGVSVSARSLMFTNPYGHPLRRHGCGWSSRG